MSDFKVGVVIPVGAGRRENVEECLDYLLSGLVLPDVVALVLDGHQEIPSPPPTTVPVELVHMPKHEPGLEQPRNVGVRVLGNEYADLTHIWFLDSDLIVDRRALAAYEYAATESETEGFAPILIGPYEWLGPGQREIYPEVHNDPRWDMFNERGGDILVAELGVALGCFSGNLMWPLRKFIDIGGFHPMLHHGRCEDGELGLRAASHRVPMLLVPEARAWHLWHEVNQELALERNRRDVPLLNSWHPWVHDQGLIVTDEDGARFEFCCGQCGAQVNTLEMWAHMSTHANLSAVGQMDDLILPDGL